jgi:hypothetical protein
MNYFNRNIDNIPQAILLLSRQKVDNLLAVENHKDFALRQRQVYNRQKSDLAFLEGKILIELDYKAQILLGLGPDQMNEDYYESNKKKVNLLSFGVFFVVKTYPNMPFINCMDIDLVTDYAGQTSSDIKRIFRHVMTMPQFREIDQPNWIIWSNTGSNFCSKEMVYFYFNELATNGKSVNLNYLVEKHGR